jgi:chemotaxis protein CheD
MTNEIIVAVGKYYVARNPTQLICIGLGSCLAVTLYDPKNRIGSLAHAMLPNYVEGIDKSNPGKYVDTSIYLMVDEILEMGGNRRAIEAKLVGGSQMFSFISPGALDIGSRNIEIAKKILDQEGIPIKKEDVGGTKGRTITFDIRTGEMEVRVSGEENKII